MRRIAPGCQPDAAWGGGSQSNASTMRPRSCTQGANTSARTRLASAMSKGAVCCWFVMDAGSSPDGSAGAHSSRVPCGLKMPETGPYNCTPRQRRRRRGAQSMRRDRMKLLCVAAVLAMVGGPAYAQAPNINLMPEIRSKTPEEKAAEEVRDKAYRESLRKIPDAKA